MHELTIHHCSLARIIFEPVASHTALKVRDCFHELSKFACLFEIFQLNTEDVTKENFPEECHKAQSGPRKRKEGFIMASFILFQNV